MGSASDEKAAMRARVAAAVAAMSAEQRAEESAAARELLWTRLGGLDAVLLYAPMPDEVDVWPLAARLLAQGRTVALPRVRWRERAMEARRFDGDESLLDTTGPGIRQPAESAALLEPGSIDAVVVPGVAFDGAGGRLGRGGGFYDRFLRGPGEGDRVMGRVIGVGFTAQAVDTVPMEPHDRRMDEVVWPGGAAGTGSGDQGGSP